MAQKPRPLQPHLSARHLFGARLRHCRVERGLSQQALGRLVHVSGDLIGKIEKGERTASADLARRCDVELGADGRLLEVWRTIPSDRRPLVAVGEAGSVARHGALPQARDGRAVDRELGGSPLTAPAEPLHGFPFETTLVEAEHRGATEISGLGRQAIAADSWFSDRDADEALFDQVRAVAEGYLIGDPVRIYTQASTLADRAFGRLFAYNRPSREAYDNAGYLYAMLAWIAGDLGRRQASAAHARSAWLCASLSGNDTVRAWVLSTMSKTTLWEGRPRAAAELAARGRSLASAGTVGVMLACQEADAWAMFGAAERARESLAAAVTMTARATADDVGGLLACGPLRYLNYASAVLVKVGDAGAAAHAADEALGLARVPGPPPAYGTLAQTRISGAIARIEGGEVDGAVDLLTPVLAIPPAQRLGPVAARMLNVERAVSVRRELRSSTVATQLVEAIGEFCAHTAGHELPY